MKFKLKAISLFSGCGGDTSGLEQAGFEVVAYSEINKSAQKTHDLNFKNSVLLGEDGDITKISDKDLEQYKGTIDLIFAGFPCQGFSHAGKKDINDSRNKLFWEFVRITSIIKPKWIIGENVAGLLRRKSDDGKSYISNIITQAFIDIGYNMAEPTVLKAEDFGIAQLRRRVFFVGNNKGLNFEFPNKIYHPSNFKTLEDILEKSQKNSIEISPEKIHNFKHNNILHIGSSSDLCTKNPHPMLKLRVPENLVSFGKRISIKHIELVDITKPTKTISCAYGWQPRLFVPFKSNGKFYAREFTIKELSRIQSFPEEFKLNGTKMEMITQIGNAVPPVLAKVLAEQVIKYEIGTLEGKKTTLF